MNLHLKLIITGPRASNGPLRALYIGRSPIYYKLLFLGLGPFGPGAQGVATTLYSPGITGLRPVIYWPQGQYIGPEGALFLGVKVKNYLK